MSAWVISVRIYSEFIPNPFWIYLQESGEIEAAVSELYCRFNVSKNDDETLCSVPVRNWESISNLFWIYSQMKGSTPGNLKTHVQRHHIGKGATTPFFPESRKGTHSAQEVQKAIGKNLFRIYFKSILNLFVEFYTAVMETHAALEAGEADPHSNAVLSTPSKKRGSVPQEDPGETRRPRAPRKPNGQVNLFWIYSKFIQSNFSSITLLRFGASGSLTILEASALSTRERRLAVSNLFRIYCKSIPNLF
jgi:hypothetical protein